MTRQHTWPGISEAGKHVARHLRGRRNRVSEIRVHVNGRLLIMRAKRSQASS
jgi:hypothetical protein